MDAKHKKKKEELEELKSTLQSPEDEKAEAEQRISELTKEALAQQEIQSSLILERKEKKKPYDDVKKQLNEIMKKKSRAQMALEKAKNELQRVRDEILAKAGSAESEEARRTSQLQNFEEALEAARSKVDELQEAQSKWLREYEEIEPHVRQAQQAVEGLRSRSSAIKSKISALSRSGSNSMAVFGPSVGKLVDLVSIIGF